MMGVKVRQKDGAWWVFINHQGRRKAKKVGDRKAAQVVAEKLQAKLALGDLSALENDRPSPTLQEYAECWLASQIHLKLITLKNYRRSLVNHVFPVLGHTTLPAITRQAIQQLVAEKLPVKKPNTIRAFLNPLVACLNQAIEDGLLTTNPAARMMHRLGRRKPTLDDQEPNPLTRDEIVTLLHTAQEHYPQYYPFVLCLARTGLRISEAIALELSDLDVQRRRLIIRRNLSAGIVTSPKNGKTRIVDMSEQLASALLAHLDISRAELAFHGIDSPIVFCTSLGTHLDDHSFRARIWNPLLRRAGLRHRGPHQLRHSFASILLSEGASVLYVANQLGHNPRITLNVYARWLPSTSAPVVNTLDRVLPGPDCNPGATDHQEAIPRSVISSRISLLA